MNKVVINSCYGGFNLSEVAEKWLKEHYGITNPEFLERHDSRLVECVEVLGEKANGMCADLVVRTIDSNMYRINEYDGAETIEVPDSIYWTEIH